MLKDRSINHQADRSSRVKISAIWAAVAKFSSLSVTLLAVPAAISALGEERFGVWITITSFFTLFGFLDGGISNAIVNTATECNVSRDFRRFRGVVSNTLLILSLCAAIGYITTLVIAFGVDWHWAISLPESIDNSEARLASIIIGFLFFSNMPLSLAGKIRQGLQENYKNSYFDILSSALTMIGTLIACSCSNSLPVFLMAFSVGPIVSNAVNSFLVYSRKDFSIRPSLKLISERTMIDVVQFGSLFLGLQLCCALAFQIDSLVVAHFVGLDAASELGVVNRMFFVATSLTAFFTIPLWAAFCDASIRGEIVWVERTFRRALLFSMAISLLITIPLLLFHSPIIKFWTKGKIDPDIILVLCVFVWSNILVVGGVISALLNGMNLIKLQVKLSAIMACINLPVSILLTIPFGASGVVLGSITSYSLCVIAPLLWIYSEFNSREKIVGTEKMPDLGFAPHGTDCT